MKELVKCYWFQENIHGPYESLYFLSRITLEGKWVGVNSFKCSLWAFLVNRGDWITDPLENSHQAATRFRSRNTTWRVLWTTLKSSLIFPLVLSWQWFQVPQPFTHTQLLHYHSYVVVVCEGSLPNQILILLPWLSVHKPFSLSFSSAPSFIFLFPLLFSFFYFLDFIFFLLSLILYPFSSSPPTMLHGYWVRWGKEHMGNIWEGEGYDMRVESFPFLFFSISKVV